MIFFFGLCLCVMSQITPVTILALSDTKEDKVTYVQERVDCMTCCDLPT